MKYRFLSSLFGLVLLVGFVCESAAHEPEEIEAWRLEMKRYEQAVADYKQQLIQYDELLQAMSRCRDCINQLRAAEQAAAKCNVLAPQIPAGPDEAGSTSKLVQHAASVLSRLQRQDYESIVSEFHYPPDYTKDQTAEDREVLLNAVTLLMEEFGSLESYTLAAAEIPIFQVGLTGGSAEYWTSLPNNGISSGVSFVTRHTRISNAIIQLTYYLVDKQLRLRSVDFAIPTSEQGARERILAITGKLASLTKTGKQQGPATY